MFNLEKKSIVEGTLAVLVSEVRICVLDLLLVEETSDKSVSGSLVVHHLEVFGVPDHHPNFILFLRLLRNIKFGVNVRVCSNGNNLGPQEKSALGNCSARVIQLAILNWLFHNGLEIG